MVVIGGTDFQWVYASLNLRYPPLFHSGNSTGKEAWTSWKPYRLWIGYLHAEHGQQRGVWGGKKHIRPSILIIFPLWFMTPFSQRVYQNLGEHKKILSGIDYVFSLVGQSRVCCWPSSTYRRSHMNVEHWCKNCWDGVQTIMLVENLRSVYIVGVVAFI